MTRSRVIFVLTVAVALCIVSTGLIDNWIASRLAGLPTLEPLVVIITPTQPAATVTPFPTGTPPPTLAPLPTATRGPVYSPAATALPVPTVLSVEARVGEFSPVS